MKQHRVRLDDAELDLVVGALRARAAGVAPRTAMQLELLALRLDIREPGNPDFVIHGGGAGWWSRKGPAPAKQP